MEVLIMLSLLLTLLLLWLFFKLGIGLIKVIGFLLVAGIMFFFFTYLLLPFLAIVLAGSLLWATLK